MWYNLGKTSARAKEVVQVPQSREKPWVIREVDEQTRRDVKAYAVQHGLSMAQAIEQLVAKALNPTPASKAYQQMERGLIENSRRQREELGQLIGRLGEDGVRAIQKVIDHYLQEESIDLTAVVDDVSAPHFPAKVAWQAIQEVNREREEASKK